MVITITYTHHLQIAFARKTCTWFFYLLTLPVSSIAQDSRPASFAAVAEKIYLQLDNSVYTSDQTIWFKAIVVNAASHMPSELSGVLYAELIDPNEQVVEKKLVKLEKGIGDNFFQLNANYIPGTYLIRAYTEWNKNFGEDFYFREYIRVFRNAGIVETNPLSDIKLVETDGEERHLQIKINRFVLDSNAGKELKFFLAFDEKKDTLTVKSNRSGEYVAAYPIPAGSQYATLRIETTNGENYSRTIILDKNFIDFRIFPESGELVQGLSSKLGFKALDYKGTGQPVEGEIINVKGDTVISFKSNLMGMGITYINHADSTEKYTARVRTLTGEPLEKIFPLPAVASKGNRLSVNKEGNRILLEAGSNYLTDDSVTIRASSRGLVYYDVKGKLKNGNLRFSLAQGLLPEGVIDFTWMTALGSPVASRLFFNERPESRMQITASTDKPVYVQREQTKVSVEIKDSLQQPVPASLSVMVINKTQVGNLQDDRQNILSYFLLSSDLRGTIENPGYYFSKIAGRQQDLDALLMTQGWQRIIYTKDSRELHYSPEEFLTISGTVKGGLFNQNKKKETGLTMMSFGKIPSAQVQKADSLGRFSFLINEEYGQTLNILIQSTNKSGKQKPYAITLDKKESPPVWFNHMQSVERPDSIINAYVKSNILRKKAEDAYRAAYEGITLQDVVVKAYKLTPERKRVKEKYGMPETVIEGDDIRKNEAKWSYGLYSVLLFNFPDKIRIVRGSDGVLYARHFNGELTLVVVDGIPVMPGNYGLVSGIPTSEVKSFEIIEYANNFPSLFCEVFPLGCKFAPATGNVIAIYTYGGKGVFNAIAAVGIIKANVPVFAAPREFYAPKYPALQPADWLKPDLRTLVHWKPIAKSDATGKASVSFYNADNPGTMQIIIEAISANGSIGYREIFYEVRKRDHEKPGEPAIQKE
jgi:hypothetical protein